MKLTDLNQRELTQIKRIAQNVDADYQKVCKLDAQIAKLTKERNELQESINEMEAPVIRMTGGYKSTDVYTKTIIPQFNENGTPKTDKEGRQLKITKYVLNNLEEPEVEAANPIEQPTEVSINGEVDFGVRNEDNAFSTL